MNASQTLSYVESHLEDITAEQVGKCHLVFDCQTGKNFYMVENEAGEVDDNGEIIEYPVRYSAEDGFTCGCKSGQHKFWNVVHPSGVCKHCRWSIAASIEERTAIAALSRKVEEERRVAEPIEVRWNIPTWMLQRPVAPHMSKSPREV